MSRLQEASRAVVYKCAQFANPIKPETSNKERPLHVPQPNCYERSDFGLVRADSGARLVQHSTSEDQINGAATCKKHETPMVPDTSSWRGQRHSNSRSRSIGRKVFHRLPLAQKDGESLDAQIRLFKEREDLRECLIPGMVSGISQKACEGWQRQTTSRSARYMANIKLGPCKDCKYFGEPSGSAVKKRAGKVR